MRDMDARPTDSQVKAYAACAGRALADVFEHCPALWDVDVHVGPDVVVGCAVVQVAEMPPLGNDLVVVSRPELARVVATMKPSWPLSVSPEAVRALQALIAWERQFLIGQQELARRWFDRDGCWREPVLITLCGGGATELVTAFTPAQLGCPPGAHVAGPPARASFAPTL